MAKCGGCGKFMAATADCIRCIKCPGTYHPICVGITSARFAPNWLCPGCKAKIPRTDSTPAKGTSDVSTNNNNASQPATITSEAVSITCQSATTNSSPTKNEPTTESPNLNVAYEIRCFREELSAMRSELREFREEMATLKSDVGSCRERVDAVENKVACLEKRFDETNPSSYDHLEEIISELRQQLNDRDQDLLLNDVIIAGIPETKDESPLHMSKVFFLKLGVSLDERDIVNAERIGMVRRNFNVTDSADEAGPRRPRVLAVRLARRAARDQLLRAARVRRGLTTADLELPGSSQRFYLNERLTPINSKLFYDARELGSRHKYKYVWTKDGRIYVKKDDGLKAQRIRSDVDLTKFFGNVTV